MNTLGRLLQQNKQWAENRLKKKPSFFKKLCKNQNPSYLWIGCSDSRVPPNNILNLEPGELFVHRNIANLVSLDDLSSLSVIEYAVLTLSVSSIFVCGHSNCGGIKAALNNEAPKSVYQWISPIRQTCLEYQHDLKGLTREKQIQLLSEKNVLKQIEHIRTLDVIQNEWKKGKNLSLYGLMYDLNTGVLQQLTQSVCSLDTPIKSF